MSEKKVIFRLGRRFRILGNDVDPYEDIKSGRKTVAYRSHSKFWWLRLIQANPRPSRAWFVVRYPKDCLPRLEADITRIVRRQLPTNQIEVHFENVMEVIKNAKQPLIF